MLGELAALSSALCWAFGTVMLRSQAARIDSISLNTLRTVVGAFFLICIAAAANKFDAFSRISPISFLALLGSLLLSFAIGDTLFCRSMELIGVSRAFPISVTNPLYVLVIAWLFLGEHITALTVLGTLLAVMGTILVASSRSLTRTTSDGERRLGVALAVTSALCFAMSTSILKIGVQDVDVVAAGVIRLWLSAVLMLLWRSFLMNARPFRAYGLRALCIIAIASVVGTGIGSLSYMTGVQQAGAAVTASIATTSPLFATPISVLFLGERLTPRNVLGMVLCLVGVWLVIPR